MVRRLTWSSGRVLYTVLTLLSRGVPAAGSGRGRAGRGESGLEDVRASPRPRQLPCLSWAEEHRKDRVFRWPGAAQTGAASLALVPPHLLTLSSQVRCLLPRLLALLPQQDSSSRLAPFHTLPSDQVLMNFSCRVGQFWSSREWETELVGREWTGWTGRDERREGVSHELLPVGRREEDERARY